MVTGISTEYLEYDGYGQPISFNVQFTFIDITDEERELIEKLQRLYDVRLESKMGEEDND